MTDWNKEEMLIKLLLGDLSSEEADALRDEIQEHPSLQEEFEVYQKVWSDYKAMPILKGDRDATDRFDQWLSMQAATAQRPTARRVSFWKYGVAASLVLLAGWFFAGRLQTDRVATKPEQGAMMQLIAAKSTTERIKGVNSSLDIKEPDDEVIEALLKLLANDESDNVRLRIVEALQQYPLDEKIKDALIAALDKEKQPIVQIAIINALVGMGEDDAKPSLENLIENEEVQPFVKDEARLGLTRL